MQPMVGLLNMCCLFFKGFPAYPVIAPTSLLILTYMVLPCLLKGGSGKSAWSLHDHP